MLTARYVWVASAAMALAISPVRHVAHAQNIATTISGVVTDSSTGTPVTAARARLVEAHREVTLHDDGRFSFPNVSPGTHTLMIQRIGYRPVSRKLTVLAGTPIELQIRMSPAVVQLAPEVVTGTLSERPRDEVLSAMSVVGDEELDRRLQATLGQTLQAQPGVTASSTGPATSRPVIRGLSGDRIVLLEDGQRPGDMSSFSGDHAVAIDPLTARQIEVVRGPMSLLYGSSALGGVVNVIRNEVPTRLPEDLHGVVSAQGSSVNSGGSIGGEATTSVGKVALRVEGSGRFADDTRTPIGTLQNTGVRTYGAATGASFVGNSGHAGLAYRFYQNDYGIPGGFIGGHPNGVDISMQRHSTRAVAEKHLTEAHFNTIEAHAGYTHYYHAEFEESGSVGTEFRQHLVEGDVRARHEHKGPFSLGAFGVRGQFRDIATGGTLETPPTRDYNAAAYAVEEITKGKARYQLGARYDHARYEPLEQTTVDVGGESVPVEPRSFGSFSGSLGALFEVTPGVRLGASLNRAYRTPDFNELYSNGPHLAANSFEVGDPRLNTEIGFGIDAFVRVNTERVRSEIAVFRNQLNGYIYPSSRGRAESGPQGGRPKFQYTNGDAVFVGADGSVELTLAQHWALNTTVSSVFGHFTSPLAPIPIITATDTTFVPASKYPPLTPPVQGRTELRYDAPRVFAGAGMRAAAAQKRLGDFENCDDACMAAGQQGRPTSGYGVWTLDGGLRLVRGGRLQTITLRVDNLFNREYRDHLSRLKEIMPEPGRDVSLVYRVQF
jgi:iron complex outermembrane receptor protein